MTMDGCRVAALARARRWAPTLLTAPDGGEFPIGICSAFSSDEQQPDEAGAVITARVLKRARARL
jgi:hypothetical protein